MASLLDSDLPNNCEIAVCDINGQVHYMNAQHANVGTFTNSVEHLPKIHITRDQLQEGKDAFLPLRGPFLQQLSQVYFNRGTAEALQLVKSYNTFLVSHGASVVLNILNLIQKIRLIFNPNVRYLPPTLITKLSQTKDWQNSTIRFISWHPYCNKLAVVTCDDSVRVFSAENNNYHPILRCKEQKNITCVAWRPMSNTELAVAHGNGIILWNLDPNTLNPKPTINNALILQRIEHKPVMSIAWSPKGELLVSVAACDNTILVWDPELDQTSALKRPGGHGQVLVKWSPSGDKFLTCSNGLSFRVWDYRSWECERWTVVSGRVQTACWSNCGKVLLFATNKEPLIYRVIVKNDTVFTADIDSSSNQALPIFETPKVDSNGKMVGGLIQWMETDPNGKYLAVMFQETNAIAVFNILRQPCMQLIPGALINGLAEEIPTAISFVQNFNAGACLTIGWSSGRIQYYPIIYSDLVQ
ncbi:unnamed protein product [Ceutorhynchus assimilis]|uniref:Aladin seven-bladed propeller domain-containing protein n=1 Tax=Ceutorhynchus assimilis TaxID=467358 RepID=A0A9N9MMB8_9CUCU|nr:unnamed protein product [Ceutorhynchus assimilis]